MVGNFIRKNITLYGRSRNLVASKVTIICLLGDIMYRYRTPWVGENPFLTEDYLNFGNIRRSRIAVISMGNDCNFYA
jgi:hypothetical protein